MRTYWHGDGTAVRVLLAPLALPLGSTIDQLIQVTTAKFGFPTLLDWTNRLEEGDEALVFAPEDPGSAQPVPGRDDLEAESLVVWVRRATLAGLFFAKTMADLVDILAMIASYEKALCEITQYRERYMEIRARHAQDADQLVEKLVGDWKAAPRG